MFLQLILILVVLIPLLAIILDSKVGQALASHLESRRLGGGEDLTAERIAFLEGEVDRLATEVRRLDEESDFLQRLLEDRQDQGATLPPGEDDS